MEQFYEESRNVYWFYIKMEYMKLCIMYDFKINTENILTIVRI